jgi:hypothetical protein
VTAFPRPARIENMVPTEETVAGYTPPAALSTIGNFFSSETLLAAKEQNWLPDMVGRELVSQGFNDDPSWQPDLSAWEQQTKHIDPDLKLGILEARSGDHYNYLLTEAANASRRRKILREAGYGGTMATVGAMITDPVSVLAMAAGPIGVAGRTGVGAWATSGAINASLSLVTEGLRAELSPDLDASDAVTGALGDFLFGFGIARANSMGAGAAVRAATGFGAYAPSGALGAAWREDADIYDIGTAALVSGIMGGAFGAVAKTREAAAFDAAAVRIANDWKNGRASFYTTGTVPTATVFNADEFVAAVSHIPPQQWADMRAATVSNAPVQPTTIDPTQVDLSALSQSVRAGGEGQTQSPNFVNPLLRPDFKLGDMDASRVSLSPATTTLYIKDRDTKVPITMSMTAWASKDAIDAKGTWFANATGTNYVPHKNGSVNRGLIEQVGAAVSNDTGNFNTGLAAMYRVEAKKAKQSGVAMPKEQEWMAQVTRAARGFTTGAAPGVLDAANAMRRGLDTNLDYYLRHAGIKREEAGNISGYVPRIQKREELDRMVKELGHEGAVTFYKNAILSDMRQSRVGKNQLEMFPDMTPDQVAAKDEKVARRMAEAAIQYGGTKSGRIYHAGMSRADAEKVLDEIADLELDDKKHIIRNLFGRDEAANPRLRARTPLDESYSEVINDKTYTIEQLLENDPRVLYARYSHEMHSGSALEEAGRVYKALFNEDMPKTLEEFKQSATKWYTPGASSVSRAEALFRQLAGYAVHDLNDELDYALMGSTQVINAGVYMQVMATPRAGAMQLTESLNHLVQPEISVPFMRKLFPVIDELSTSAMSGQLSDTEIIADAQLAGFGRGYASRIPGHVMDAADGYAKKLGPVTTFAERAAHFGNKWMSGEGPIGNSQEIAVYAGSVGHWVDFAVGRTGPLSDARLQALNLTPELQTEIGVMIRRFGKKDPSGQIKMPNERAWSNQAAAAAFREAVYLSTRRLTNFGDASSMPTFAAKWYGKLFLQLRRFALRATGNYLGFNARMADRHAAITTASAAATGMLQYVVANVIAAATVQDREEFLNERLTTENIAKAAFARSAMAGIMPTVVDASASAFGYDSPFSQYRQAYMATGASGVLANFAAADSLKNLTALPGAVLRPIIESDYDFSERNYNTITKGLFLPNYMGSLRHIREELNLPSRSETAD